MSPVRVLLADDQGLVRAGFRALLDDAGDVEVVGEAGDGAAAVELARSRASRVPGLSTVMPSGSSTTGTRGLPGPPLPWVSRMARLAS